MVSKSAILRGFTASPEILRKFTVDRKREDGWMWVNTSKGESSSSVHTLWKRHFNFVISEWNIRDTYMSDSQCSVAGCDMYSKVAEKNGKMKETKQPASHPCIAHTVDRPHILWAHIAKTCIDLC